MKPVRRALLVAAAIAGATGCNMLLGIEEHELSPQDAATGSGGSGGAATTGGGQGGTAGQGGAAGQGATAGQGGAGQGGAAGQGGNPPNDASAGRGGSAGQGGTAGQAGAAGQGGTAGQSGAAGQGGINRDASDEGVAGSINRDSSIGGDADAAPPPSDADMADVPSDVSCSTPGATECRGGSVFLCIGGIWVETQKCPYACVVNVCGGVCVPGSTQCTGNTPQTCDATGTWQNGTTCTYVCAQGACTGMCVPGTMVPCGSYSTCNDGAYQTCDFAGTLGACNPAPSNCEMIPAGWQPVAKPASGNCPSGFGSPQTMYTSATGAAFTCTCGCTGAQSCAGSVTLNEGMGCAGMTTNSLYLPISTTCASGYFGDIIGGYGYTLSDVVFEPSPSCFANPSPSTQPPVQSTTITLCTPDLACTSGACLSQGQAANLCVAKSGMETCPAGYPNGTTFSPWYDDTRTCGSCTCASNLTCALDSVLIDNLSTCSTVGHMYWMNATTSCMTAPGNYPIGSVKANGTTTGTPTCAETAPSLPMGTVELNQANISTVCCK